MLMVGIIFLAELIVMFSLRYWGISGWYSGILDSVVLTLLLAPAIFYLIVLPLKRQHDKNEAENARLEAISEHIPDGLISINSKGIIQQVNPALLRMFGYERDELLGVNVSCLMPEPYRHEHDGYLQTFFETGERHVIGFLREVEGRHKLGHTIDVELQVSHLSSGKYHLFIGLLRDISQRKKQDEEQQAMRAHIEHAQRLESLGVLAGGVAHDFNNILTAIMGNASLAQMQLQENRPLCEMMEQIENSSVRASELCKQMLAYAGKGRFVVQSCDITQVVRNIYALIRSSTPSHVCLDLDLTPNLPMIEADASQLQQVLINLCMNANEAIANKGNGRISIRTGRIHLEDHELKQCVSGSEHGLEAAKAGDYVFISVDDNGGGIHPDVQKKMFEPFFTTHFTGRGLGLSACLGIVRSQNGVMRYNNRQGEGVCIQALFPVATIKPKELSSLGCVLVAENDAASLQALVDMLGSLGLSCFTAHHGDEALRLFHEHHQQIGVVMLNMRLLKVTGVEALHRMRERSPQVKAVLLSRYDEAHGNSRLAHQEGAYFLRKPIDHEKLRTTLQNILMDKFTEQ